MNGNDDVYTKESVTKCSPVPLVGPDVLRDNQLISAETFNRKLLEKGAEPVEFRPLESDPVGEGVLTSGNLYREYFISRLMHQFNATLAMRYIPSSFREETLRKIEDQRAEREYQEKCQAQIDAHDDEDVKPDAIVEGN